LGFLGAAVDQHEGRHGADFEFGGELAFGAGVDLDDLEFAGLFRGDLLQRGREGAARGAGRGVEIDEDAAGWDSTS
jgi:hypothetical protein